MEAIIHATGAEFGWVIAIEEGGSAQLVASRNLPSWLEPAWHSMEVCPTCERVVGLAEGELNEPNIVSHCPLLAKGKAEDQSIPLTHVAVPLRLGERTLGTLNLMITDQHYTITDSHDRLLRTIAGQFSAAIERSRLFEHVQQLARTDSLTGLLNRRQFMESADRELERSRRYRRDLSVIMLDIDFFKKVNDTYGHLVGDQVLQAVAAKCRANRRQADLIGRYGGEEFVILLPETNNARAMLAAERLRGEIGNSPIHTDAGPVRITVSLGIATLEGQDLRLDTLIDRADQALYLSKQTGRDMVSSWHPFIEDDRRGD
jgi:diguanylate cyclase (GGDEF)-like protein